MPIFGSILETFFTSCAIYRQVIFITCLKMIYLVDRLVAIIVRSTLRSCLLTMPADSRLTRERLLTTAARLFAENGYEGVSLRSIASAARTHLALIHYHFGSKDDLYRAIWASRYGGPIEWRTRKYAAVDYSSPREEVLQQLVEIFLRPIVDLMEDPDGRAFLRIMAHEMIDSKEPQRGVLRDYLDPTGRVVVGAFCRALPEAPLQDIAWGFQAMAGAALLHMAEVERITRVSDGTATSGDIKSAFPRLRAFLVGGWLQIARRSMDFPAQVGKFPWRESGEAPLVVLGPPDEPPEQTKPRTKRSSRRKRGRHTPGRTRVRGVSGQRRSDA